MRAVVLMTALPPTMGHLALVRFARDYLSWTCKANPDLVREECVVVLGSMPSEPVPGAQRAAWLAEALESEGVHGVRVVHLEGEDTDPQWPDPSLTHDAAFWQFWSRALEEAVGETIGGSDVLVSSEEYGDRLAAALDVRHVPYDPPRRMQGSRATDLRRDPARFFSHLVPPARRDLRFTVTLFGAESVGKSTVSRAIGTQLKARVVPEWARTFLEREPDPAPTPERMLQIVAGQAAAQVVPDMDWRMVVVRDTDLLSTVGYYRILGLEPPGALLEAFEWSRSDLYLLLDSGVPMVPDPLRYGGGVRESSDDFWVDLLREFGCTYEVVTGTWTERAARSISRTQAALWASSPLWRHVRALPPGEAK